MNRHTNTMPPSPEEYHLVVKKENRSSKFLVTSNSGSNEFIDFSATKGFKIYMVAFDDMLGSIVYVGITKRSMKERFTSGFGSIDDKNIYSWATSAGSYRLLVWDLSNIVKDSIELEVVEAELAFAVRVMQRWWPTGLKSITFKYFQMSNAIMASSVIARNMIEQYFDILRSRNELTGDDLEKIEFQKHKIIILLEELSICRG